MNLYIVRHGQTDYNKMGIIQGVSDIPLNETGVRQAEKLKLTIDKLNIDLVISSPLVRTKQTATILVKNRKIKIIYDNRLLERGFGILEGKGIEEYDAPSYWNYKLDYNIGENVEKISQLFIRTNNFLQDIKSKYQDKNILIVSHGATIRALHFNIVGFNKNHNFLTFKVPNCSLFQYIIK